MKNFLIISLPLLFYACSTDDFASDEMKSVQKVSIVDEVPSQLKQESHKRRLTEEIKAGKHLLVVPKEVRDQIFFVVSHGRIKSKSNNHNIQTGTLNTIFLDSEPIAGLFVIVEESVLDIPLQENLKNYILNLKDLQDQGYQVVDDFILEYEISKHDDQSLTVNEKEAILSISSTSEAVLYSDKKRKDRDWETSTANREIE